MIADLLKYLREIDLNEIFTADYSDAWDTIVSAIRDPQANLAVAILVFVIATLVVLGLFLVVLAFITGADDDEEEEATGQVPRERVAPVQLVAEPPEASRLSPAQQRLVSAGIWLSLFALAWLGLGWGTSNDAVCAGCHTSTIHMQAQQASSSGGPEEHRGITCVQCHESASAVERFGWGSVSRSQHFVRGMKLVKNDEYGRIGSHSCLSCHSAVMKKTVKSELRGVRMSHREPVEAGAACLDCHGSDDGGSLVLQGGMSRCITCHNGKKASTECKSCHLSNFAGAAAAEMDDRGARELVSAPDCGGCHNLEKSCDPCHGIRMPHSSAFLAGTHARDYAKSLWWGDGKACVKCHNAERRPCGSCHTGNFPGHAKSWGRDHQGSEPRTTGCNSCHNSTKGIVPGRSMCIDLCHLDREDWR